MKTHAARSLFRPVLGATLVATVFAFASLLHAADTPAAAEAPADTATKRAPKPAKKPLVQLALLLDTSNSMDGLIDQARSRLWQVVNDLARAKQAGATPRLEVALYEYGNDRLSSEGGYIREVAAFTDDLDDISAKLFALTTDGGSEFCGAVIDRATARLAWSRNNDDLKMIFIAGNEPFTQGPVDFRNAVRAAIEAGITVNTIFCGAEAEGANTGWRDGAVLADGTFSNIDQNQQFAVINAPQDKELAELNTQLNRTYLAYGSLGRAKAEMQRRQDANATASAPSVAAQRTAAKASSIYSNTSWDLVDATNEGTVDFEKMKDADLPEELRGLNKKERKAKLEEMKAERARLQKRIQEVAAERETYVTEERARQAGDSEGTALDDAIRQSVRAQAAKKNYQFE